MREAIEKLIKDEEARFELISLFFPNHIVCKIIKNTIVRLKNILKESEEK